MTHSSFFGVSGSFFHRGHCASIHEGGILAKLGVLGGKQWKVSPITGQG